MEILENILLAPYTGFKIGGPAKFFCIVKTKDDCIDALEYARNSSLKVFILGSGTNLLVSDSGFDGLVIRNSLKEIFFDNGLITAGAGLTLAEIFVFATQNSRIGFERMATVPGTLGGALYNNAHYLDDLISNYIVSVDVYDSTSPSKIKTLSMDQLDFKYDSSKIKTDSLVVLSALIKLPEGDVDASKKYYLELLKKRGDTQPYGTMNAGCMFQNVSKEGNELLVAAPGNHGVSAGWLIDQAGLKGKAVGNIEVSTKHGNFFINRGKGTAADVEKLIELCKESVYNKFKVDLELEIKILKN